ncbi:polysaccharide deacetylase family protein [bacterium]|nr:polysaccharide deacetylase family protein [bacterium]
MRRLIPFIFLLFSCGGGGLGSFSSSPHSSYESFFSVPVSAWLSTDCTVDTEMGGVPILMYHNISSRVRRYSVSPDEFRYHLEVLWQNGFYPVGLSELLDGLGCVPAGKKPVVLTFDDAKPTQFFYIIRGDSVLIDPLCAVGIILDFHDRHPDFPVRGVFFIPLDGTPFGQQKYVKRKIRELSRLGFEIGNHTASHTSLRAVSEGKLGYELGKVVSFFETVLGVEAHRFSGVAYPYGILPSVSVDSVCYRGRLYNISYGVGVNPALCPSPKSREFAKSVMNLPRFEGTTRTVEYLIRKNGIYISRGGRS